jgi:branched-subunit amino acid aminotransferase/4-amino-4-deoxychorismate lyase
MNNILFIGNPSQPHTLRADSEGVLFGWGAFETLRTYHSHTFLFPKHAARLRASAQALSLSYTISDKRLEAYCNTYIREQQIANGIVRITLLQDTKSKRTTLLFTQRNIPYTKQQYSHGHTATIATARKNSTALLTYHKTTNYLENMLSRQNAQKMGFDEALFLNENEIITEGTVSNIFFIKRGILFTPHISCGLLPGITRQFIIDILAPALSIATTQGSYSMQDLLTADEAFLTNTAMQVMPLVSIDNTRIGSGKPGKKTMQIMNIYPNFLTR